MMASTIHKPMFFEVHSDPALRELWFPGNPRPADGTVIDASIMASAESWQRIRDGKKVVASEVSMPRMRYWLTVYSDGILQIDAREFAEGRRYQGLTPVSVPLDVDGPRPEFTFGSGSMPVISDTLAEMIESLCPGDVQRFPITVLPSVSGYEILNVIATADCFDETLSHFKKWTPENGRPERVGDYRDVYPLRIDPRRTDSHDIFRILGWVGALIVSDRLKTAMEGIDNLGVVFEPVTEP